MQPLRSARATSHAPSSHAASIAARSTATRSRQRSFSCSAELGNGRVGHHLGLLHFGEPLLDEAVPVQRENHRRVGAGHRRERDAHQRQAGCGDLVFDAFKQLHDRLSPVRVLNSFRPDARRRTKSAGSERTARPPHNRRAHAGEARARTMPSVQTTTSRAKLRLTGGCCCTAPAPGRRLSQVTELLEYLMKKAGLLSAFLQFLRPAPPKCKLALAVDCC